MDKVSQRRASTVYDNITTCLFFIKSWNMLLVSFLENCLPGWHYYQGSCYSISSSAKSWTDSKAHCLGESANLVNIGSPMENEFIRSKISERYWSGLREVADNQLNWVDDENAPDYVNWIAGQPVYQDGRNDCVYVQSGSWRLDDCGQSIQFVCEKG